MMSTNKDERTIDVAKTASIDMMMLNNKVVNMRQIVKQSKVQVINKLCKNIASLKKKKGSDEQKAQNLRKAERFVEEIDSIKHLKEDKVSKYALANTTSFSDVSKVSQSAGPRALARLADHPLMKKAVEDFRSKHSDWRDLAAYLLIKQTGRRFKTKKQKERNKLTDSVANINASETMTKAYIQERFGQDGLAKAELRFERKRKRAPFKKSAANDEEEEYIDEPKDKKMKEDGNIGLQSSKDVQGSDGEGQESSEDDEENEEVDNETGDNDDDNEDEEKPLVDKSVPKTHLELSEDKSDKTSSNEDQVQPPKPLKKSKDVTHCKQEDKTDTPKQEKSVLNTNDDSVNSDSYLPKDESSSSSEEEESETDNEEKETAVPAASDSKLKKTTGKRECVIKELRLGEKSSSNNKILESSSDSEDSDDDDAEGEQSKSESSSEESEKASKDKKKKTKSTKVPAFLTNKPKKLVSDPFFAGSDDEDGFDDGPNDFDEALRYEPVGEEDDYGGYSNSRQGRSMFHNPHEDGGYRRGGSFRGGRWQERGGRGRGGDSWRGSRGVADSWRGSRGGADFWRGSRGGGRGRGDRGRSVQGGSNRGRGQWQSSQDSGPSRVSTQEKSRTVSEPSKAASSAGEKLHPSWEASKKRRAEQNGIQAFKGTKITFEDD